LAILHDASYIEAQSLGFWRHALWHVLVQVLLITLITVPIMRWSIVGPIARTTEWLKGSRDDEQGALILSAFAGASRELHDALIVNTYDTEALADAIRSGLEMDSAERAARMQCMRRAVKEQNNCRWAANLVTELGEIRIESRKTSMPSQRNMGA
jgi:hypothetical protein